MVLIDTSDVPASAAPRLRLSTEAMRSALLWLMAFAGAFVFVEPSPYEVVVSW